MQQPSPRFVRLFHPLTWALSIYPAPPVTARNSAAAAAAACLLLLLLLLRGEGRGGEGRGGDERGGGHGGCVIGRNSGKFFPFNSHRTRCLGLKIRSDERLCFAIFTVEQRAALEGDAFALQPKQRQNRHCI